MDKNQKIKLIARDVENNATNGVTGAMERRQISDKVNQPNPKSQIYMKNQHVSRTESSLQSPYQHRKFHTNNNRYQNDQKTKMIPTIGELTLALSKLHGRNTKVWTLSDLCRGEPNYEMKVRNQLRVKRIGFISKSSKKLKLLINLELIYRNSDKER